MNAYFERLFAHDRVMVILRGQAPDEAVELATQAWDNGIHTLEVPIHTPAAVTTLRAVVDAGRARGLEVGAGTVISEAQVSIAAQAGAAYTVAPGMDETVARASIAAGLPHIPGVGSATDIQTAIRLGLDWVKAFPATALGPEWIQAMKGPFPSLNVVATGGISHANAQVFLDGGAVAVGIGSGLSNIAALAALNPQARGR